MNLLRMLGIPAPAMKSRPPLGEVGYAVGGVAGWGQFALDEHEANPDLRWPASIEVFDRMRDEESQVASVLKAVMLPVRRANWALDGTGCDERVLEVVARDLDLPIKGRPPAPTALRRRNRFSWAEHLRLAQLELVHGHSVFEQVYEIVDGQARLKKLAWRPPRTISEWGVAADGGLKWIKQHSAEGKLDVSRLVVYVNEREGGNWVGKSLLRPAYKNWLLKDRILRVQAMVIERNGLGVPTYTGAPVPEGASTEERDQWSKADTAQGLGLATSLRSGDAAGASIPHGSTLDLKGVSGRLPDTDKPIRYHDEQIARAVLAHFLNLGTQTGSWALGSTFADFFTSSLQSMAMHVADVTQQHVIDDLVDLNWGPTEPAPQLVFDEIGSKSPATAEALKLLVDAGLLTPTEATEARLRDLLDLPVLEAS